MATPSIQTLITQAQQVLNLQSSNEIRATLAAVLANANVGTPLNPNLTTQQLWNEFGEIVRQSTDDIMSIITDQMMRMMYAPPAPGGAGADKQVIFNDGGVLAGDTKFLWDKNANRLDVDGPVVITGDLTVDTSTLKVDSTNHRVGIGTATPACKLEVVAPAGNNIVSTFRSGDATAANNAGGGFQSISSATAASRVVRVWLDADGADLSGGDYFFIQKNGNSGTVEFNQSSNAAMTFLTNATERARIDATGSLLVGATTLSANEILRANSINAAQWAVTMTSVNRGWLNRQSSAIGGIAAFFEVGSSSTNVGSITTTASATAYVTVSDYRLKENVQPLVGGLARISALKPSIYKWKVDGSDGEGFIAHELADIVPAAVTGKKDDVNADGTVKAQGVDLSKVVPILVAAIQELTAEVNALKNA